MAEWLGVGLLILMGVVLILVEILFIPGTTKFGIGGLIAFAVGIYLSFNYFGTGIGILVLAFAGFFSFLAIMYALRSNTWNRFSLKTTIASRVNEEMGGLVKKGDTGTALSAIKPIGKAEFEVGIFEVISGGGYYIDDGAPLQVTRVDGFRIYVEPIKPKK